MKIGFLEADFPPPGACWRGALSRRADTREVLVSEVCGSEAIAGSSDRRSDGVNEGSSELVSDDGRVSQAEGRETQAAGEV